MNKSFTEGNKMRTPTVTSRTCGQDSTTPEIFQEATNLYSRGQDGVVSRQDGATSPVQEVTLLKQTSTEGAETPKTTPDVGKKSGPVVAAAEAYEGARSKMPCVEHSATTAATAATAAATCSNTNQRRTSVEVDACGRAVNLPRRFKQHYQMDQHLSTTLYGNIFTCFAKKSGKKFACKVMSNSQVARSKTRGGHHAYDDPATEVKLLRLLRNKPHPHLLSLVDQFVESRHTYFVLPLARGGDLLSSVQACPHGLDPGVAQKIFRRLVGALQHLHTLGWQHGDLSLENILITSASDLATVKLCDFGLSTPIGSPGRAVGKILYMAPEVVVAASNKTEVTFKTSASQDIFSLGVAMFMALFGFPPFECACDKDANYRDLQGTVEAYRTKLVQWRVCPTKARSPLVPLLMKMMLKNAEERPTLTEILDSLNDVECH